MAQSLSSVLRRVSPAGLKAGSVVHPVLTQRWYGLSKRATGEHSWDMNRSAKEAERDNEPAPSLDELIAAPMANLETCRYARVSKLNEVYDLCMTADDIRKAERLLVAYRHGLGVPSDSIPLVVVRACVRAGIPERALHYARNKGQFKVFPTRKVYKILMNAFLKKEDAQRAMAAYGMLLTDELTPDGMTYHIAAKAALRLELDRVATEAANQTTTSDSQEESSDENEDDLKAAKNESCVQLDVTKVMELCVKCFELEPKLGTKSYRVIVTSLLSEGHNHTACEVLTALEAEDKLPKQTLFNLKLDLLTSASSFDEALSLLRTECGNKELGMPKEGLPRLRKAIAATGNTELIKSLDGICADTSGC